MEISEVKAEFGKALDESLKPLREKLGALAEDLDKEKKSMGVETKGTKDKIDAVLSEMGELKTRLTGVEQKMVRPGGDGPEQVKTAGEFLIGSEEFKAVAEKGGSFRGSFGMKIPADVWRKTAIINASTPAMDQPLVAADRIPGVVSANALTLRIRALISTLPTSSNTIAFTRITAKPTAAASQGKASSPLVRENVAKAESAMTFELVQVPVETVAHWIPASKQVLADAPQLQGIINTEMLYGLKKEEDRQLLLATGTNNELFGLINGATAYDTALDVAGDTKIDTLRRALLQLELANHTGSAFVLNPTDWADIELKKDSQNRYIYGSPSGLLGPNIWGRPVVSTAQITVGDFLAFDNGPDVVQLFDRQDASITISTEHSDFFIKNMVAILCEERLALVIKKPLGLVTGTYPASA